jgi:hypothetical protein
VLISYVWPEPQSSAAGLRNFNVIDALLRLGFEVVIASAAQNEPGRLACQRWAGEQAKLEVRPIQLNDSSFDAWIGALRPDLVIFDRFMIEEQFGWRVRQSSPESICILDTVDLHFVRFSRERDLKRSLRDESWSSVGWGAGLDWDRELSSRELASIHRVDLTWLVSDFERELLVRDFGLDSRRVAVSRFAYPEPAWAGNRTEPLEAGFSSRSGFCLIGNFRHAPNLDAFRWMRTEVWPRIRAALPRAELHVYGAYPPKEVMEAHSVRSGFLVHGPAQDLKQVFSGRRVSLAPLRFGAGIKGKISDSWWHGVPVASTSIGFEGMSDGAGWGGRVADTVESFALACVELHENEAEWKAACSSGFRILGTLFSGAVFDRDLEAGLSQAESGRAARGTDWVRQMMCHATLDSYRYFGKWLELKQGRVGR